jgi:Dyp-type peroxidase family
MAVNLNAPLKWRSANTDEKKMLDDLQGNILNGHGRRSTMNMFIRFGADQAKARAFVKAVGAMTMSMHDQLKASDVFKATGVSAPVFVTLLLTKAGYVALGAAAKAPTGDAAFDQGHAARAAQFNDPPVPQWDEGYRGALHALVIIGGEPDSATKFTSAMVETKGTAILNLLSGAGTVVATETGRAIFKTQQPNEDGTKPEEGIEHFGYVDGRSQPLLLQESIDKEADGNDGISVWDPAFPLKQVLVADPGSTGGKGFGSFFVFRKLDQNVKAFKAEEAALGETLHNGELAGAEIVGRFEDGTPVVLQRTDGMGEPVPNNFDYASDPRGVRCPMHAHIRKSNPRGDSVRAGLSTLASERSHIMARRGITYGKRNKVLDPTDEPEKDRGLLFMAYQASIANQFEFTQSTWVNNPGFPAAGTGIDPIIGQPGKASLKHNKQWGDPSKGKQAGQFGGHVKMRGGGYFFAPARSTLASL